MLECAVINQSQECQTHQQLLITNQLLAQTVATNHVTVSVSASE